MNKKHMPVLLLAILFGIQNISGQGSQDAGTRATNPLPDWVYRNEDKRRKMDEINGKDQNGMIANRPNYKFPAPRMTKPNGEPYSKEELEKIKAMLEPNPADLYKYRDFLKQPKTGMFRLFNDFECESKNIIRVDQKCENFIPGSWSYSFRLKNHTGIGFYDVRFHDGDLIGDGFLTQQILAVLGDISPENVSLESAGMKFLNDFKPEAQSRDAKKQFSEIANVVESDGYKYSKRVKAVENMTYAARVIAYRTEKNISMRIKDEINRNDSKFLMVNNADKRVDLTLVFRIIRKDEDGSITILWKELQQQNSPKIVFQKNERLSDIKEK